MSQWHFDAPPTINASLHFFWTANSAAIRRSPFYCIRFSSQPRQGEIFPTKRPSLLPPPIQTKNKREKEASDGKRRRRRRRRRIGRVTPAEEREEEGFFGCSPPPPIHMPRFPPSLSLRRDEQGVLWESGVGPEYSKKKKRKTVFGEGGKLRCASRRENGHSCGGWDGEQYVLLYLFLPGEIIARERKLLRVIIFSSSAYSTEHIPHFPSGRETGLICLFFLYSKNDRDIGMNV